MQKVTHIVGIDEVGRGPLAGPVTVCACVVAYNFDFNLFKGIKDSKKLSLQKREEWFVKISDLKKIGNLNFALTSVSAREIDNIGIAVAIKKALDNSLEKLSLEPKSALIKLDGALKAPEKFIMQETIIKGDEKIPIISAASIIAKVMRDRYMIKQAKLYPNYGLDKHKGYGTAEHFKFIRKHGLSSIHRKSFLKKHI